MGISEWKVIEFKKQKLGVRVFGFAQAKAYQTVFVRSQHAPFKYSNFLANRYCKYLSFLKSAFTALYLQ